MRILFNLKASILLTLLCLFTFTSCEKETIDQVEQELSINDGQGDFVSGKKGTKWVWGATNLPEASYPCQPAIACIIENVLAGGFLRLAFVSNSSYNGSTVFYDGLHIQLPTQASWTAVTDGGEVIANNLPGFTLDLDLQNLDTQGYDYLQVNVEGNSNILAVGTLGHFEASYCIEINGPLSFSIEDCETGESLEIDDCTGFSNETEGKSVSNTNQTSTGFNPNVNNYPNFEFVQNTDDDWTGAVAAQIVP